MPKVFFLGNFPYYSADLKSLKASAVIMMHVHRSDEG